VGRRTAATVSNAGWTAGAMSSIVVSTARRAVPTAQTLLLNSTSPLVSCRCVHHNTTPFDTHIQAMPALDETPRGE
jgi:hypothetical protein